MRKFVEFLAGMDEAPPAGCVLAGDEGFLRAEAERAIVKAVLGDGDAGPSFVAIDGVREGGVPVEVATVLDEAHSLPLFAPRKVVSVRRAGAVVKRNADLFARLLGERDAVSVVVLHIEDWDKRSAYAKKLDEFAVDCASLYETSYGESSISASSPLGRWVRDRASSRKLRLEPEAVVRLIEMLGSNLAEIDAALERLDLMGFAARPYVAAADVDAASAPSRATTQFRVAELATRGRAEEAFAAASACFEMGLEDERGRAELKESSVASRLVWAIGREIEILYAARGLIDEERFTPQEAGRIGVPPFRAQAIQRAASEHPVEVLARGVQIACEAEHALKTGRLSPRLAVEKLVLELGAAMAARPAAER